MQRLCDSGSRGTERIMITTTILNPLRARWTSMRRCYAPLTCITKAINEYLELFGQAEE